MARGIELPDQLVTLLSDLGYLWPDADETRLTQLAHTWIGFQDNLDGLAADAHKAAERVWTDNRGADIDAFRAAWLESENPLDTLRKDAAGVVLVGALIVVCALVVLVLKIWVTVQLVLLAIAIVQALATAEITFGASLAEIPVFKEISGRIIDGLISRALMLLA